MYPQQDTRYRHVTVAGLISLLPFFTWLDFLFDQIRHHHVRSPHWNVALTGATTPLIVWWFAMRWTRIKLASTVSTADTDRVKRLVAVGRLLAHIALAVGIICAAAAVFLPEMRIAWAAIVASCGSSAAPAIWALGRIVRKDEW
jgi:small-conductance mechanosensitive channel